MVKSRKESRESCVNHVKNALVLSFIEEQISYRKEKRFQKASSKNLVDWRRNSNIAFDKNTKVCVLYLKTVRRGARNIEPKKSLRVLLCYLRKYLQYHIIKRSIGLNLLVSNHPSILHIRK